MAFEPTIPGMIRIGTGLLWLGLGLALIAGAKGRVSRRLGQFFVAFGPAVAISNAESMVTSPAPIFTAWLNAAAAIGTLLALVALGVLLKEEAVAGRRGALQAAWLGGSFAAVSVLTTVATYVAFYRRVGAPDLGFAALEALETAAVSAVVAGLGGVVFLFASAARDEGSHGHAWLAAGMAVYPAVYAVPAGVHPGIDGGVFVLLNALAMATPVLVGLVVLGSARAARGQALAWSVSGLAAFDLALAASVAQDFGDRGIARALAFGLVAYAFLAHLNPRRTGTPSRGATAAGALAVLFIVAQVAQNFLSDAYGLLTGGVVAGAFLFAAQPLQRAMERLTVGQAPSQPAPLPAAAAAGREDAYRDAVRLALKDRRFDPEEEVALANLADHLGLSAKRSMELRHQVEREKAARGKGAGP